MLLKVLFLFSFSFAALTPSDEVGDADGVNTNIGGGIVYRTCVENDSFIALNRDMTIDGKSYRYGTEIYFDDQGNAFIYQGDSDDVIPVSLKTNHVNCKQITVLPYDRETGEIGEYNIPIDFELAGKKTKPKKRGGTTYCYRGVKAVVNGNKSYANGRLRLSGVAAYMANNQLAKSGLKKYSSYQSAPKGSICVFNKGGKVTSSGGHKYGHIGIKGRGGVIDPMVGFNLKRPFLGCYGPGSR